MKGYLINSGGGVLTMPHLNRPSSWEEPFDMSVRKAIDGTIRGIRPAGAPRRSWVITMDQLYADEVGSIREFLHTGVWPAWYIGADIKVANLFTPSSTIRTNLDLITSPKVPQGWTVSTGSWSNGTSAFDNSGLNLFIPDTPTATVTIGKPGGAPLTTAWCAVIGGFTYTGSLYVRTQSAGAVITFRIIYTDAYANNVGINSVDATSTGALQRLVVTGNAPANARYAYLETVSTSGGILGVKWPQLTMTQSVTPWTVGQGARDVVAHSMGISNVRSVGYDGTGNANYSVSLKVQEVG